MKKPLAPLKTPQWAGVVLIPHFFEIWDTPWPDFIGLLPTYYGAMDDCGGAGICLDMTVACADAWQTAPHRFWR